MHKGNSPMQHQVQRSLNGSLGMALVRAITEIDVSAGNVSKAVNQLELVSYAITHTDQIEPSVAIPMKASFEQKIGQIADLNDPTFTGITTASWVTKTLTKLSSFAAATVGNGHDQSADKATVEDVIAGQRTDGSGDDARKLS